MEGCWGRSLQLKRTCGRAAIVSLAVALCITPGITASQEQPQAALAEAQRLLDAGDFAAAAKLLRARIAQRPDDGEAARLLAQTFYWLKDIEFENTRHPLLPLRDARDRHGMAAVARGNDDFYVDSWAADVARFQKPLFLRFAHHPRRQTKIFTEMAAHALGKKFLPPVAVSGQPRGHQPFSSVPLLRESA